MQAAQVLAGYSLGGADLLRRAMGKKIKAEMDAQRAGFVEGCASVNGIAAAKANELFDLIDKFAGYGFNKSHAAAYALLAYQTAWLKAHYPHEFYAASMCYDMHQTDKLAIFVDDMRRLGVALPAARHQRAARPSSTVEETSDGLAVRYALAALKCVGEGAMEQLVDGARREWPRSTVLDDFARRVDPRLLNKRQLETLAGGGRVRRRSTPTAPASSPPPRRSSRSPRATHDQTDQRAGRPVRRAPSRRATRSSCRRRRAGRSAERMEQEKEAFGFYFSAHPVDRYRAPRARCTARARYRRARRAPHPRRRQPRRRDDGGAGRGRALAHLRARASAI